MFNADYFILFCIYAQLYVVTASHCVDGQSANRISVVIGEQDYASAHDGANPQRFPVSKITMHERYNSKTIDNDIAVRALQLIGK